MTDFLQNLLEGKDEAPEVMPADEGIKNSLEEGEDDDLDPIEEANLQQFAEAQEQLSESMNIVRLNKQTRLLNLSNRTALVLAKRANDPLYEHYAKFNGLRLKFRAQIVKKYGSRASAYARKLMSRTSTAAGAKK